MRKLWESYDHIPEYPDMDADNGRMYVGGHHYRAGLLCFLGDDK